MSFLLANGTVTWVGETVPVTIETFHSNFEEYLSGIDNATDKDGVVASWYQVYKDLTSGSLTGGEGNHCIFLNSFGVDTRKVVTATVRDESNVIQVAVNFELWEQRDVDKFKGQFTKDDKKDEKKMEKKDDKKDEKKDEKKDKA